VDERRRVSDQASNLKRGSNLFEPESFRDEHASIRAGRQAAMGRPRSLISLASNSASSYTSGSMWRPVPMTTGFPYSWARAMIR
jgi:hypothetical protein